MVVKTFGERTAAALNSGMYTEPLAKGMHICGQKESARKSLPNINTERLGLPEAGELLQSHRASR